MTESFLCIVDCDGLKSVFRETEDARRWLGSRLADRHDEIAFWSVLDLTEANVLYSLLEAAEYSPALRYLESKSRHFGRYV